MKQLAILLGLSTLLAGAAPVYAQRAERAGSPAVVEHAQLGLLEAVGAVSHRIVIALPGATNPENMAYQSYDTNYETQVQGMGSEMRVSNALGEHAGQVVVVTYVTQGDHYLAKRVNFAPDRMIRETRGTISSIDAQKRLIVIENAQGTEERFNLGSGPGAAIDANRGIMTMADLRVGERATVYFGDHGTAYLVRIA